MASITLVARRDGRTLDVEVADQAARAIYSGVHANRYRPVEAPWAELILVDQAAETRRLLDTHYVVRSGERIVIAQIDHPSQTPKLRGAFQGGGIGSNAQRLADVDGAFALIEIEPLQRTARFACDKWGLERLHWKVTDEYLIVSSEAGVVARFPDLKARIDPAAYARYLTWRRPDPEVSLLEGVNVTPTRECISVELMTGAVQRRRYFSFNEWIGADSEEMARVRSPKGFFEAIADACEGMATGAGRNVLSVTGGADSRIIVAALHDRKTKCDLVNFVSPFNRSRDEILADPSFLADDFIEEKAVEQIVEMHTSRRANHTVELHELIGYAAFREAIRS